MTFKDYLKAQMKRKDRVGDLSRRLKYGSSWKGSSYEDIYGYLYSMSASEEEIQALKIAYEEFNGEKM